MTPHLRLQESGAAALSLPELLSLFLGPAGAEDAAAKLLTRRGGLRGLARCGQRELIATDGIGPVGAARIVAACELGRRMALNDVDRGKPIAGAADVYRLLGPTLRDLRREVFVVLLLDGKHRVARQERVSEGSLTSSIVHPREVFALAIREGAAAIVVAHNHPSGDPTPSREDVEVTMRLQQVGELVGIMLLDHVVIGDTGYVSLRERGHIQ